ncbi:MAG: transposase [Planctomycetia bacterium]
MEVGRGFKDAAAAMNLTVRACAILPDHVHLVVDAIDRLVGEIVRRLKAAAIRRLKKSPSWPSRPRVWAEGHWHVYLDDVESVRRAVAYIEENPLKEGKPRQFWSFVTPFDE